jgi:hypothetical protein
VLTVHLPIEVCIRLGSKHFAYKGQIMPLEQITFAAYFERAWRSTHLIDHLVAAKIISGALNPR